MTPKKIGIDPEKVEERRFLDGIKGGIFGLLETYEKECIQLAFKISNYNQARTAEMLQMGRSSLRYKLKKYGFESPLGEKVRPELEELG
jgi:DNA-binding NtrC family response regulator